MNSDASNGDSRIWATLHGRQDWRRYFTLQVTFGTTQIFQRTGTPAAFTAAPRAVT